MFISINSELFVNTNHIEAVRYTEEKGECEIFLRRESVTDSDGIRPSLFRIKMDRVDFDDIVLQLGCVR